MLVRSSFNKKGDSCGRNPKGRGLDPAVCRASVLESPACRRVEEFFLG